MNTVRRSLGKIASNGLELTLHVYSEVQLTYKGELINLKSFGNLRKVFCSLKFQIWCLSNEMLNFFVSNFFQRVL